MSGSEVPVTAGVVSFVGLATVEITGASGGEVSTVKTDAVEAALTLPARSVAIAVTECCPSVSVVTVIDQDVPEAVPVPIVVLPSFTVTEAFDSLVPEITVTLVVEFALFAGVTTTGAAGAVVSITIFL